MTAHTHARVRLVRIRTRRPRGPVYARTSVSRIARWDAHCRAHRICRKDLRGYAWSIFPHYCVWCLTDLDTTTGTLEHRRPISRGGKHCVQNLMGWACRSCNSTRGNRLLSEFPW